MTLGLAAATWQDAPIGRLVVVAADTRITYRSDLAQDAKSDAGVKTYELGGRCAMVAAGAAVPPMMAAELTRSLVENHNRRTPDKPISYFDTVRMLSFFLKRSAHEPMVSSHVAVVGFLEAGAPCIASVVVSPAFNKVAFVKVIQGGTRAIPVGRPDGCRLLLESMAEAKRQGRPPVSTALAMLSYIAKLEGAFETVGGGISVGTCSPENTHFQWPVVELGNRRFLRGMDVTSCYAEGWPNPEKITYDEAWCIAQDRRVASEPEADFTPGHSPVHVLPGFDIDQIAESASLFRHHNEPPL